MSGADGPGLLPGRRALVTGAATGIGRATAARLAREGAAVVANFIGDPGPANELVEGIEAGGGQATAVEADVSNEAAVERMFHRAAEFLGGPVDLLVNNAGIEEPHRLVDMPLESWQRILSVNLTGPFLCARAAARALLDGERPEDGAHRAGGRARGVIVNVSSVHEVIPWEQFGHYCASKGGLKLFGQTIAKELAPHGIRVLGIAPGAIETPINRQELAEHREEIEAEIPLRRPGAPEEIAAAIAWLASDEAAYVTGSTLFVDGGMTTYGNFV